MSAVKTFKTKAYRMITLGVLSAITFTFIFITIKRCGIIQIKNPKVSSIVGNIKNSTDLSLLNECDKSKLRKLYNINAGDLEEFRLYAPKTNMDANQILILKVKDQNQIEAIKENLENQISRQAASFKDYRPDQYDLIENYSLKAKGKYLFLVVSKDVDKIIKSINHSFL